MGNTDLERLFSRPSAGYATMRTRVWISRTHVEAEHIIILSVKVKKRQRGGRGRREER